MKQLPGVPELLSREFDQSSEKSRVAESSPDAGEDYALVIGVNHYPDLRPLRGAIADAQAFADWLFNPNGGHVSTGNARVILSTADPLTPIGHEIDDALEEIMECAERTGGRRFYFYFSGHGAVGDRASDIALCMPKWSDRRRRAALSSDAWLDVVVRSSMFSEVAFFLDCCRVWATRAVGMPPRIDFVTPTKRDRATRVFLAYATEFQRAAIESDGHSAGTLSESRGIFTKVLIDVLQGHAAALQVVTAASLKKCIEQETEKQAREAGFYQCADVLNGFRDESGFGSGQRIAGGSGAESQAASGTSYHNAKNVLQAWGRAYDEFRQRQRLQVHRPAMEYPHISSRLQVVVFPHERRQRSRAHSSANRWSICAQFKIEDLISPGPLPFNSSTRWSTSERIKPIALAASASENSLTDDGFFFSGNLTSGAYVVRRNGQDAREFAVRLFRGWTTLIVIDDSPQPHFENAKIFLIPHTPDEALPGWCSIEQVALIMNILNLGLISPRAKNDFRDPATSFDDPMLGLLAAHSIARLKDPDATRIESIASQVKAMIGPCPDVDALLLRAALIRGGELPRVRVTNPPMLREGLLAFVEASHKMPDLIPPGSLLEHACVERLVDSPISSWPVQLNLPDSDDWLTTSIEDLATQSRGETATLDATTIARELGVPTQSVTTRLAVTRERMTRSGAGGVSTASKDTSSGETVPLPPGARIVRSPVPPNRRTADTPSEETGPLSVRTTRQVAIATPLNDRKPVDALVPSIPGYQIERLIGKGGMGQVYLAKRIVTGDRIAIKVIHQDTGISIKARQRFLREIDTLSVLRHDRIVALLDHGYANGYFYFTMPFYERGNVADWVKRCGRPTLDEATRIIRDVLEGLAYAHQRGYVHRDIKPQNLLLDDQDRVLLADFGLAKEVEVERSDRVHASDVPSIGPITTWVPGRNKAPRWLGTPAFMPPEQVHNFRDLRASSDVWAVAAVFYWLLCGHTPRNALAIKIDWRRFSWPVALSNLLDMAASDDPEKRPPDAAAFRLLLEEALKTAPNTTTFGRVMSRLLSPRSKKP